MGEKTYEGDLKPIDNNRGKWPLESVFLSRSDSEVNAKTESQGILCEASYVEYPHICVDQQAFYHRSRNGYVKLAFIIHLREDVLSRLYLPDCNGELTHNNQQKPQTIEHLKIISNWRLRSSRDWTTETKRTKLWNTMSVL